MAHETFEVAPKLVDNATPQAQVHPQLNWKEFLNESRTNYAAHAESAKATLTGTAEATSGKALPPLKIESSTGGGTDVQASLKVDGIERQVDIHLPRNYDPTHPTPVLYMLSGQAGKGQARGLMEKETRMDDQADQKDFIAVYPVPLSKPMTSSMLGRVLPDVDSWNAEGAGIVDTQKGWDDISYIKALTEVLPTMYNVDRAHVGIAGFSEGGEFAEAAAARIPNTFSSVISDNGTILGTEAKPWELAKISALIIHGDHNQAFPLSGGSGLLTELFDKADLSEPEDQAVYWQSADKLNGDNPQVSNLANNQVTKYDYAPGAPLDVQMMIIKNGKNAWDGGTGGQGFWKYSGLGDVKSDIPVSQYTADFFLAHPKAAQ